MSKNAQGMWTVVHQGTGLRFVAIPAEKFPMGSIDGEGDEKPVRPVTIARVFLLCETEVTQGAWTRVMGSNPSNFKEDDNRPVENVSWEDAQSFCRKTGLRLPSEAEWEYACRAGTRTKYFWGDTWEPSRCMAENDEGSNEDKGVSYYRSRGLPVDATAPVKSFGANPWGLFDMHGNVWEWCEDWYGSYSDRECPEDGSARTAKGGSSDRVYRGGGWIDSASLCRSALRVRNGPPNRWSSLGFRPAEGAP
jgi:formylglycine-generating enzyme required for sulfatase activity